MSVLSIAVSLTLVLQGIGCLSMALVRYKAVTRPKDARGTQVSNIISTGFSLHDLARKANSAFGGIIMTEYAVTLFYSTFGIYFSTIIIEIYDDKLGRINQLVLILGMVNITLVVFSIYRVYLMQAMGQELCNHFSAITENLEDLSINFAKRVEDKEVRQLEVLIARFSAPSSPIRPCDVFNMNTANFVSIGRIILTYLIVLLQFKISSKEGGSRFNLNIEDMPDLLGNRSLDDFIAFVKAGGNRTLTDWQLFRNQAYSTINLNASIQVF